MEIKENRSYWDHSLSNKVARNGVLCQWHEFPDGYHAPSHSHTGIEVIYPKSGEGAIHIGGADYRVSPGVIFIFPASLPHRPLISENYRRWNLCILPDLIEGKPRIHRSVVYSYINTKAQQKIHDVFQDIKSELEEQDRDTDRYVRLLIKQFVIWVRRGESHKPPRPSPPPQSNQVKAMNKLFDFIEANLQNDLSIAMLAKEVNYSSSHIWRIIHSSTNQSPIEYINNRRLERARRLLIQSEYPISVIANMVGFRSSAYFSHKFKVDTGLTPREYRENATP